MKICLSCEGVTDTQAQRCGHCGGVLLPTEQVHYPTRRGEIDAGHPLLGTVIDGKYRLLSVLGRGGLGTVFRAQHIGSLVVVALKLLHPRFSERPEYRRALVPEARRAATVVHERCARVLDVGEGDEGVAYLAMELVDGETVDQLLRHGRWSLSHAVEVLLQVAEALEAVHRAGLVHCDLSPRNVMVSVHAGRLDVKVLDFGIARSVTLAGRGGAAELSGFANPAFSAPELLAGGEIDMRADFYSFGTLAWLLLTGEMPVDDSDPRLAAEAVRAGRLAPWPRSPRLPRRLVALVRQCMAHRPAQRPASAKTLLQRLILVKHGRGPLLARAAMLAGAVAVTVAIAAGDVQKPVFLRPWSSSAITLAPLPLAADHPAVAVTSERLDTIGFHYAGFDPELLRAELLGKGRLLHLRELTPDVDRRRGTLVLSLQQPAWRDTVTALAGSSREGPVDLAFVVPGDAPLGGVRLRLDDEPPELTVSLTPFADRLVAGSTLRIAAVDNTSEPMVVVVLRCDGTGPMRFELPPGEREFALGMALAARNVGVADLGPGQVEVHATDAAGNTCRHSPIRCSSVDVAAPEVLAVTGPANEPFATRLGDRVRLRIRVSDCEAGAELRLLPDGGEPMCWPLPERSPEVPAGPVWLPLELPTSGLGPGGEAQLHLLVVDAAGNEARHDLVVSVRDRTLALELVATDPHSARWDGQRLICSEAGAELRVAVGANYGLLGARLESAQPAGAATLLWTPVDARHARFELGALAVGDAAVVLQLADGDGGPATPVERRLPLVVLPRSIEVRLPRTAHRYLPELLQAGVLARRGQALGEGPGWYIDPNLRPFLAGTLWLGVDAPAALPVRSGGAGVLLPDVVPVPGRNRLMLELHDVLDRPVHIRSEGATQPAEGERALVADFWWRDAEPEVIGEEQLVEFGSPLRVRMRLPLPFLPEERQHIRLGIAQEEVSASHVTAIDSDRVEVSFDLPFALWSVAARLSDQPREVFAQRLTRSAGAYLSTPAGSYDLTLQLRTTRSTLAPMALGELPGVPPGLASIRLLPVLAPNGPFAEPVPPGAPPRALFRPQVSVAVRNLSDVMLQDRELNWGEARALSAAAAGLAQALVARCVHHDDPLGVGRVAAESLLPRPGSAVPDAALLTGVDFFQAYTLSRLLGAVVAGDPSLFRLPLGCELELAAFGGAERPACSGVVAHGGRVPTAGFLAFGGVGGADPAAVSDAAAERRLGDVVPTGYGCDFLGLDFGAREWVFDLPHIPGAEMLMREWIGDQVVHLQRVRSMAEGRAEPAPDPIGPLRSLGVVRGLAFGEANGLLAGDGSRVTLPTTPLLPASVPGVLRTEQLRRDGRDLLLDGPDARLRHIGLRVVGSATAMARLWGGR